MALIGLTVVAYLPVFRCSFVWDDDAYVTENRTLESSEGLWRTWTDLRAQPQYYPLVFTTYWIEYRMWGTNPAGYHVTNLALHALAAVLVFFALIRLGLSGPVAWLSAALFAVHPVHVESVAWIAERKNVLSAVFYLAALLAYLKYDSLAGAGSIGDGPRRAAWYGGAILLFLCALASKTVTASLPAVLLLMIWWKRGHVALKDAVRLTPFIVCGVGFGLLTLWVEREHVGAIGPDWEWSLLDRLLIAGRAIWFYVIKLTVPIQLTFVYPRWEIDPRQAWQYLFPLGVVLSLCALWVARRQLGRGPLVAVLFFVGTLLPALGLFNVYPLRFSYVADHFQYLASLGWIVLVVASAANLACRAPRLAQPVCILAATVLLMTFAVLTWQRAHAFRDTETLWRDTLAKNPTAWIAHQNLGVIQLKRGELEGAARSFRRVLQLQPGDARAHNNLASLSLARGDVDGAIVHFEKALAAEPDYVGARLNMCKCLLATGRVAEATEHYLHALHVDPDVAIVQSELGLLLLTQADNEVAARFFTQAIELAPNWSTLINERAWRLATARDASAADHAEAVRLARRAVELTHHRDPNTLDTLAAAYAASGQFDDAIATAKMALALVDDPDLPLAGQIRRRLALYGERRAYQESPER